MAVQAARSKCSSPKRTEKDAFEWELKYLCWLLTLPKYMMAGDDKTQMESLKKALDRIVADLSKVK